jgi:hypothetical protein
MSAIFDLDVMLFLIHQEMGRLEQGLTNQPSLSSAASTSDQEEGLFHFIHPSLDDDEGWKIHNEVKRLVRRQSVPDIIKYLRNLESEKIILLPTVSSVAYDELVRMGMPNTGGFSKEHFRKQYHL